MHPGCFTLFSTQRASFMSQLPPPLLGCGDTAIPLEPLCIQLAWLGRENGSKEATRAPRKYLTLIKTCVQNTRWSSFSCASPPSPWGFPSHPNEAGGGSDRTGVFELERTSDLSILGDHSWELQLVLVYEDNSSDALNRNLELPFAQSGERTTRYYILHTH